MQLVFETALAPVQARRTACAELCAGLAYLHELASGAITHRDLKPSNLLFKGDCLKIADMGQSRRGRTAIAPRPALCYLLNIGNSCARQQNGGAA